MQHYLESELKALQHQLLKMGGIAENMLRDAVESVLNRDEDLAQRVIEADDTVDILENEIEARCIQLIARHQPVAFELRYLTMALKVNRNIERLADKCVSIARRSIELLASPPMQPFVDLPSVTHLIQGMVQDALDALVHRDAELARELRERDSKVNAAYEQMVRDLCSILASQPQLIQSGISVLLLFRHLERVGDLAANIGEEVYYLVEGEVIRHSGTTIEASVESQ
ncbi:phosphate transport system regulatory protein PhoU [Candidatus Poribacteria bacterium]|nr:MAG: phosphate transport system regulatory protein PhoU [Candidatus Poribacteria bacterium]